MKWTIKQANKKEIKKYAMRLDIGVVLASLLIGLGGKAALRSVRPHRHNI